MHSQVISMLHEDAVETTRPTVSYAYISSVVVNVFKELGAGLSESIYHKAIVLDLLLAGFNCECERMLPIVYKGIQVGTVRADIVVASNFVIELKAVAGVKPEHFMQVRRYGALLNTDKMMLVNFPNNSEKPVEVYQFEEGYFARQ